MGAVTPAFFYKRALLAAAMLASAGFAVSAQQPVGEPVEVVLVQQDFSDCQNGNVNPNPIEPGGVSYVQRLNDGTTAVKIAMTAKPNTKYHFFLKCVRLLGDIQTGDEGVGEALFTFRTNETGNVFAFDMYPDGAPLGNKYQSAQVKMQ
jgi:hypothetical protein